MTAEGPRIQVYKFGPLWAAPLPSAAPFPLKLEAWLRIAGLPYDAHVENDTRKGPKKKSPWIVDGDVCMGDTELVIAHLARSRGKDPDARLSRAERARALAFRRLLEEHYHQVLEHAFFLDTGGDERLGQFLAEVPAMLRPFVRRMVLSAMRRQLWERGVGRHSVQEIVDMGRADLDAVDAALDGVAYFLGDEPSGVDATVFAFTALTLHPRLDLPLFRHARALPNLGAYCGRMIERFFPEARSILADLGAREGGARPIPIDSARGEVA